MEDCEVVRLDKHTGLLLRKHSPELALADAKANESSSKKRKQGSSDQLALQQPSKGVGVRVHISQLADTRTSPEELAENFHVSQTPERATCPPLHCSVNSFAERWFRGIADISGWAANHLQSNWFRARGGLGLRVMQAILSFE